MKKGWHNESRRHSMARKGIKTGNKMSMAQKIASTKNLNLKDTDKDGVADSMDCRPLDPKMQDEMPVKEFSVVEGEIEDDIIEEKKGVKGAFRKVGSAIATGTKFAVKKTKKAIEESKFKQRETALKELKRPEVRKFETQASRVNELRGQLAEEKNDNEKSRLEAELQKEERQLRVRQEEITNIKLDDFSDRELKILAIRQKDTSIFSEIFGSGNIYKDELIRRIKKNAEIDTEEARLNNELKIEKEKLNKELNRERKEARNDEGKGFFDF